VRTRKHSALPWPVVALATIAALASPPGCTGDSASRRGPVDAGPRPEPPEAASPRAADASPTTAADEPPGLPPTPPDLAPSQACVEPDEVALFVAPRRPMEGVRLRLMIVADDDIPGATLWVRSPAGEVRQLPARRFHGPPHAWSAVIENPGPGTFRVALATGEQIHTCEDITPRTVRPAREVSDVVWPVNYQWDHRFENLYSAWIMQLFHSDPAERPSWSPLHEVLRDPERNWLYNRLGLDEDGPDPDGAITATPDCADTPYYLRAYFAWKMRLPFVFSSCTRGRGGDRPQCSTMFSNLDPPREGLIEAGVLSPDADVATATQSISELLAFEEFMNRVVVSTVQSGAGRTMPDDDRSDLYPIELSRESIRPGTVFVDPYGHLLVVSQWVDQTDSTPGMLFAVDGHPDLSIGRKRFWRGAFLFVDDLSWGAGGFKAFRPVFVRRRGGTEELDRLTNAEIAADPDWGNYSDEQYRLGTDGFYDRMDRVINPRPLDPAEAQRATLNAFYELVQERIDSVQAGEDYLAGRPADTVIEMPDGPEIFETSGAWEDYSTPARDLRLLIAIDLITRFPDRVTTTPTAFSLPADRPVADVVATLRRESRDYLASHSVTYRRSGGAEQRITLADVVARQASLEMAYNPNDCIEIRWGAPEGSPEHATCRRHAPAEQQERMRSYRAWFNTRSRPPRR
jgi:hypothetical protein